MGEWFDRAKAAMLAANASLKAETIDLEGTVLHAECKAIEILGEECEWILAELDADTYLDTAAGAALSRWGADRYKVYRQGATASVVELSLTRPTAGAGGGTISDGTIVKTEAGTRFRLDEDARFTVSGLGPVVVTATSVLAGSDQNVDAGTITAWDGAIFDATIEVTNPAAAAGGNEAETDEQYRSRVRTAFVNARKATVAAIRDGALSVDEVREAAVYEYLDASGNEVGAVAVIVADETGASNTTLEDAVDLALDEYRAAGVQAVVSGATVREEAIAYTVVWATGQATSANELATRQAVVAVVNRLDPNGAATAADAPEASQLTPGLIETAVRTIAGVVGVTVTTPAGAVAPDNGEVIRTSLALVTAS